MPESPRPDRKAAPGTFCVWIERIDKTNDRLPNDFKSLLEATGAAEALVRSKNEKTVARAIVYDDRGRFKFRIERK